MATRYPFVLVIFVLVAGTAFHGEPSVRIVDLDPVLQQALVRDATACSADSSGVAIGEHNQLLESPVVTQEIRAAGREAGVIATPRDGCHCRNENCSTFVYLRSGDSYKLAFADTFASLRPMKAGKHGLPSLSGKFQVTNLQEETTIFDWNGTAYQRSLCATVTQHNNQRIPTISQHPCTASVRLAPTHAK